MAKVVDLKRAIYRVASLEELSNVRMAKIGATGPGLQRLVWRGDCGETGAGDAGAHSVVRSQAFKLNSGGSFQSVWPILWFLFRRSVFSFQPVAGCSLAFSVSFPDK